MGLKTTNEGAYSSPEIKVIQVLSQSVICQSGNPTATGEDPEPGEM